MADDLLFTLHIHDIYFEEDGLPRYPSLIDYDIEGLGDLHPEPSLRKVAEAAGAGGPFEVLFSLDGDEPARFAAETDGQVVLRTIDGEPIDDSLWTATAEDGNRTCRVTWTAVTPPTNQVLRLDCVLDATSNDPPPYLLLALVRPTDLEKRRTDAPKPLETRQDLPYIELHRNSASGEFFYPIYRLEAYEQLSQDYRFEPALRARHRQALQFAVVLAEDTGISFAQSISTPVNRDEVPVQMPPPEIQDGVRLLLEPTLRDGPQRTIATWNAELGRILRSGACLSFHLEIQFQSSDDPMRSGPPSKPVRKTVDPTIIEEPPAFPPVNGAKHDH